MSDLVKGLPEGVEFTGDFHPAGPDDYELVRDGENTAIYKGVRIGAAAGVKVTPAEGYVFVKIGQEMAFDIRLGKQVPMRDQFAVSKMIPPKSITVTAKFTVSNEMDLDALEKAIATVPSFNGYVSMEQA